MSSVVQDLISAMEFAADRGLRHFAQTDGKTRLAIWREGDDTDSSSVSPRRPTPDVTDAGSVADAGAIIVRAPLPGLCHLSPDPTGPAFVTEGMQISAGQTICIVEAMKVMTAVAATHSGIVTKIHVTNGATVLAGDGLIGVQP
ncbi:MAG: acetyl-CoA carboxylase biotin carboxyl carrier protein [Paracoccaceae bacterium]